MKGSFDRADFYRFIDDLAVTKPTNRDMVFSVGVVQCLGSFGSGGLNDSDVERRIEFACEKIGKAP
jgi:hypothetical protein